MSLYGDPDQLDELAAELREQAGVSRDHAADHVRQGQAAHWVSTAATAYRELVNQDSAAVVRAAESMEKAADLLSAHAEEVREKLAQIARFEREATAWFESKARSLAGQVEDFYDEAGQLIKRVAKEPPWSTWPIGPQSLPGPGDAEWLEVGRFMSHEGVI